MKRILRKYETIALVKDVRVESDGGGVHHTLCVKVYPDKRFKRGEFVRVRVESLRAAQQDDKESSSGQ